MNESGWWLNALKGNRKEEEKGRKINNEKEFELNDEENSKIEKSFKFRPMNLGKESIGGSVNWLNGDWFSLFLTFSTYKLYFFLCLIC